VPPPLAPIKNPVNIAQLLDALTGFLALEPSQPPRHIGRIRLNEIVGDWSENQALNPRLLAAEVADAIRSISQPGTPVAQGYAVVVGLVDNGPPADIVTMWALAEYFDGVSIGCAPDSIITEGGSIRAGAVLLARNWLDRLVTEATERAAIASGLAQVIEAAPGRFSNSVALAYTQPTPPSGSAPECLAIRQAQQRIEGEQSAAEHLEIEQAERQRLELEVIALRARLATKEAQVAQLIEEGELQRREISTEKRARREAEDAQIIMEVQLEDAMAFAECLRLDNPTSPPEMRMAFMCWRVLTRDGTHDPAARGGRGCHPLVDDWVSSTRTALNKDQTARLKAMVSWRKRGAGAIPTR
jgi:hypothetical protein